MPLMFLLWVRVEREARLGAEQTTPGATQERVQQSASPPEPAREPQRSPVSREKAPGRHQGTDTRTATRTSSAIWETPKPPLQSMARRTGPSGHSGTACTVMGVALGCSR
ncbi:hypothetical protein HNR06_002594 [Nocardiopsis arvandica]|uniref:Uncharacterized protein n=1 Tax=Nocardiopsis sinuspersici TaxID=501010 RepID=A0A7Y9XDX1_9ACTN|nr:hypothetical protein [Nocardiopsis sinuspersici]